jgi:hypothetical protein
MALEIKCGSDSWVFEPEALTMKQLAKLEDLTGVSVTEWLMQIDQRRARALQVLVWHLRGGDSAPARVRQSPENIDFKLSDFSVRRIDDVPLEDGEGSEPSETSGSLS